jgi:hypothetical protein
MGTKFGEGQCEEVNIQQVVGDLEAGFFPYICTLNLALISSPRNLIALDLNLPSEALSLSYCILRFPFCPVLYIKLGSRPPLGAGRLHHHATEPPASFWKKRIPQTPRKSDSGFNPFPDFEGCDRDSSCFKKLNPHIPTQNFSLLQANCPFDAS